MKEIKEITTNIGNISKEQVATDLSKEEKEELMSLINLNTTTAIDAPVSDFCPTTPPPCPACDPKSFCCVITVPTDLLVDTTQVHAAVSQKCTFTIVSGSTGTCNVTLNNGCTLLLHKARVNGCAQVFASLGVKDVNGNCTFLCCSDCVCFLDHAVVCCGDINPARLKFVVSNLTATKVGTQCDKDLWKIEGFVTPSC